MGSVAFFGQEKDHFFGNLVAKEFDFFSEEGTLRGLKLQAYILDKIGTGTEMVQMLEKSSGEDSNVIKIDKDAKHLNTSQEIINCKLESGRDADNPGSKQYGLKDPFQEIIKHFSLWARESGQPISTNKIYCGERLGSS